MKYLLGIVFPYAASLALCFGLGASSVMAQDEVEPVVPVGSDSVMVHFIDADLRFAVQALARYLDRPVVFGSVGEYRITLETPAPVPRASTVDLLRAVLGAHGLEMTEEPGFYSIGSGQEVVQADASQVVPDVQLFIIRLRHARADDISATVNALYGQASAFGEMGALAPTLSQSLSGDLVPPVGTLEPGQQAPVIERVAQLGGLTTVIPDPRTNSLMIRASRADFELIQAAVQELDVRPLQVLIEVVIAEVRRDRGLGIGVDASIPRQPLAGSDDEEISASNRGLGLGDFVLNVMKLGGVDLSATLSLAASRGDARILSRPVILAANNATAEILVGSQRPFVQVQRALPTDAPIRDQVVQFKDVGTRLTVLPTISEDGYVMMEVAQEVNAATAEVAFDAPVISTRSVRTQLLVRDGQTAVLGGLADSQEDLVTSGIPLLSAIPIVGGLFGSQVARTTETELFLFLTPRVIRTDDDLQQATDSVGNHTRELRGIEVPLKGSPLPAPRGPGSLRW